MIVDIPLVAIGFKNAHVNTNWDVSGAKMAPSWRKFALGWNRLVPNVPKLGPTWLVMRILNDFRGPKQALGPSQGVRGGTKAAPRRHQGGLSEAH